MGLSIHRESLEWRQKRVPFLTGKFPETGMLVDADEGRTENGWILKRQSAGVSRE